MERFKMIACGYGLFIRDDKILLVRRSKTGYMDGFYGLPSGHIEDNEPLTQGTLRELLEETGVALSSKNIRLVHIMHRRSTDIRMDFFFEVSDWKTDPINTEPDKCDDMRWFALDSLPENVIPYIKIALQNVQHNIFYSELGWKA
jgi:ADP-ribose pyrophosphatase YjhB (NUDIX family)